MYVELKNVNKIFGNYQASKDVSFGIEKGKLIGLLGPSGSGKTTILRMIAGLETPDSGDIIINGNRVNDIDPSKRGIGFVFQNYALFRYMTVYDNIAFGLEVRKEKKAVIKERVMELVKLIGLEGLEKRYPNQLSGGQRQRVAFARALAPNPSLLLLDEPFAAIDAKVRQELRSWLRSMIDKVGVTSIFVTHDQDEAIEVANEIIVTNLGRVEQMGTPIEIYKHPSTPFVAQFVGNSTVFDQYHRFKGFDKKKEASQAIVRPEFIRVIKKGEFNQYPSSAEEGIVEDVLFRGNCVEVKININGTTFTAHRSLEDAGIGIGEKVEILIYRIYLMNDNNTYILENKSMEDSNAVII